MNASVAQSVEQLFRKQQVSGSNPDAGFSLSASSIIPNFHICSLTIGNSRIPPGGTEINKKISVITIFPSPLRERVEPALNLVLNIISVLFQGVRVLIGKCQVEDIERIEMLKVSNSLRDPTP